MKTAVKPESHELGNKKLTNSELQKQFYRGREIPPRNLPSN